MWQTVPFTINTDAFAKKNPNVLCLSCKYTLKWHISIWIFKEFYASTRRSKGGKRSRAALPGQGERVVLSPISFSHFPCYCRDCRRSAVYLTFGRKVSSVRLKSNQKPKTKTDQNQLNWTSNQLVSCPWRPQRVLLT